MSKEYTYSMPQQFIDDPNVALKWKLYGYLNGFWISGKSVYARNDTLAKNFNKSERAIQSALEELEGLGLVTRDIKGLSRYILPGGLKVEGRSPASPTHEAQLHPGDEAQLHHISDSISDSIYTGELPVRVVEVSEKEKKSKSPAKYPNAKTIFSFWGPYPRNWDLNATQLRAAENLFKEHGLEEVKDAVEWYETVKDLPFCPQMTSPYDLDSKWDKLEAFSNKV